MTRSNWPQSPLTAVFGDRAIRQDTLASANVAKQLEIAQLLLEGVSGGADRQAVVRIAIGTRRMPVVMPLASLHCEATEQLGGDLLF